MRQLHTLLVPVAAAITLATAPYQVANAQQPSLKRTAVLDTDMAGMEGKQAHMWVGDLAPGAETGKHTHPTPRFVYVMEGSVMLEVEGQPPRTFKVGEGFQEVPGIVHNRFCGALIAAFAR